MMQTFGDTPFMKNVPEGAKKKIMHAQLPITETVHLMASDNVEGVSPMPFKQGNNFNISIVANAPWGPYFGMVTDRFGVQWMVSLPNPV
jgi:PhnB protein